MALIGSLHEIILYVSNMDAQVRYYRDVLELPILYPDDLDDYADQYWVVFKTGECSLALHGGGKQDFGSDAPKFVFRVEDVTLAREELIAKGVTVGEVRSPAEGVQVADCLDPEGNRFSIESGNN